MIRWLIGIDDTDNLESRGTGHLARRLAECLSQFHPSLTIHGISRHQLFFDSRIPFTSHNSSACIELSFPSPLYYEIIRLCERFLTENSASGSDVGFCFMQWDQISTEIIEFGKIAKVNILNMDLAYRVISESNGLLSGLRGSCGGIIGALAAVGLRKLGNDGRLLWRKGLRELAGIHRIDHLISNGSVDCVQTLAGVAPPILEKVQLDDWVRPVFRGGKAVLIVEETPDDHAKWHSIAKDVVKRLSD